MRRTRVWLVAGTVAALAAGCGGGSAESKDTKTKAATSSGSAAPEQDASETAELVTDAPKGFDKAKGVPIQKAVDQQNRAMAPVALAGSRVISYDSQAYLLRADDAVSPTTSWTLKVPVKDDNNGMPRLRPRPGLPPLVNEDGTVVYAAYRLAGRGTTKGGMMVVLAVDVESGKLKWSRQLATPATSTEADRVSGGVRQLLGSRLVVWSDPKADEAHTWTLDAQTGEPGWEYPFGVTAANDDIGTAVDVTADRTATVIGLADGTPLGTVGKGVGKFEVAGSSDAGVLATTNDMQSNGDETESMLLDPKTGAVTKTFPDGGSVSGIDHEAPLCTQFGDSPVAVCVADQTAKGIDVRTGQVVWDLYDEDLAPGSKPAHATQFHGRVYVAESSRESVSSVVLDGQTGKEITKDGIAVELVNETGGLEYSARTGVTWYPASP